MATSRRLRFVHAQAAWLLAALFVLTLFEALSLELFFVVSLVGFLVVFHLTAPFNVTPRWRRPLEWFIAIGLVVFGYIVVKRILELLPRGVF